MTMTVAFSVQQIDDLLITLAYFSIPLQIVIALGKYYPMIQASMQQQQQQQAEGQKLVFNWRIFLLGLLFALFIFLCGTGHLLRCMNLGNTVAFQIVNTLTALVSIATAFYLVPSLSFLMDSYNRQVELEAEAKRKLLEFMNFLCHEIRNPLFAITSTLTFLESGGGGGGASSSSSSATVSTAKSEQQQDELEEALSCIHQSSNLMLRLVNDVLDISKLETGDLELEVQTFDMQALVKGAVRSIKSQLTAVSSPIQLGLTIAPKFPLMVRADAVRILQIAYNLLSNAAKFTEEGSIVVRLGTMSMSTAQEQGFVSSNTSNSNSTSNTSSTSSSNTNTTMINNNTTKSGKKKNNSYRGGERNKDTDYGGDAPESTSTTTFSTISTMIFPKSGETESFLGSSEKKYFNDDSDDSSEDGDVEEGRPAAAIGIPEAAGADFESSSSAESSSSSQRIVLTLQVQDTGPGMSDRLLSSIREPYSTSKLSQYRSQGGTGLGLTILDRLTSLMGGSMQVESKLGAGSTFTVYIPLLVVPTATATATSSSIGQQQQRSSAAAMDMDTHLAMHSSFVGVPDSLAESLRGILEDSIHHQAGGGPLGGSMTSNSINSEFLTHAAAGTSASSAVPLFLEPLISPSRNGATTATVKGTVLPPVPPVTTPNRQKKTKNKANMTLLSPTRQRPAASTTAIRSPVGSRATKSATIAEEASDSTTTTRPLFPTNEGGTGVVGHNTSHPPTDKSTIQLSSSSSDPNPKKPLFEIPDSSSSSTTTAAAAPQDASHTPLGVFQQKSRSSVDPTTTTTTTTATASQKIPSEDTPLIPDGGALTSTAPPPPPTTTTTTTTASAGTSVAKTPTPTTNNNNKKKTTKTDVPRFEFRPGENVVLVVDDNAMNRKIFGRMLKHLNLEPVYATQGQEAVDYMKKSRNYNPTTTSDFADVPQVGMILMDWSMPVMDGSEAIRQIRNKLGLKEVPIVAVTACATEARKEELLGAGADEFATKPLLRADLIEKCRRYLETTATTQ